MKKQLLVLSLIFLFVSTGNAQSDKIKVYTDNLKEVNYLKVDNFYLTHHLYIDMFLRENLFSEASKEDVSYVINAIKKYVSLDNSLDIEIEKPGKRNYKIKIAVVINDDGKELFIVFTNWNIGKKIFEKEIDMKNDSYTRWYFLNGNKMTYRKDMSDKNNYDSMSKSDLTNAYLFDELPENDVKIIETIDEALKKKNQAIEDKIMTNLILLKYLIFKRDSVGIVKQVVYLNELFEANKSATNLRGLKMAFDATLFQMEMMRQIIGK